MYSPPSPSPLPLSFPLSLLFLPKAAVRHLNSSLSHQFTLALPHRDPSFVRALLHYLYTGQVKGEDRSKPADLATDMEAFVASTAPLSLHFQPPEVNVGKGSDGQRLNSPEWLGMSACIRLLHSATFICYCVRLSLMKVAEGTETSVNCESFGKCE